MKGIQFKIVIMAVAMTLAFTSTAFSDDRRHEQQRLQNHQMDRIHDGVARGVITDKEYQKLQKGQRQLRSAREKAWADGKITRNERKRLFNLKQKSDRHIYMAKHNHQKRYVKKNGKYSRDYHQNHRHDPYPPSYKYDNHYRKPHYRQNDFTFSGTWMKPFWGFSFYTGDRYRK